MSVRRAPAVPGGSGASAVHQENRKRLEELLKLPDNAVCADCPERGPRWASATLGTFICIKCSGIHRNLGVHISFVRSVNLDEWKQEHVEQMERWGNARARAYYEAEVPSGYARPSDWSNVHQMTRWIKDKYEYKRFIPRDGALPPEKQPTRAGAASPSPATNNEPSSSSSYGASTRERRPRERPGSATSGSTQKPQLAQPVPAAKPKVVDLLDFSEPDPPAPQPPQQQPPPQQQAAHAFGGGFDAFGAAPAAAPQQPQQQQQQAAPTAAPPQQPQQELTSAGKPKLTADQLISMFMQQPPPQPAAAPAPAPYAHGGMGGMQAPPTATPWGAPPPPMQQQQQPQAYGFPPQHQQPPQYQQQPSMMMGMAPMQPPPQQQPPQQQAPRPPMGMGMPSSGYPANPPMMPPMGGASGVGGGFVQNPYAPPQQQPHPGQPHGFAGLPGAAPQHHQQQQHASPFGTFPHPRQPQQQQPPQQQQQGGGFPSPFGHPQSSNPFM